MKSLKFVSILYRSGGDSGKNPIAQLIHQIFSHLVPRSAKVKLTVGDRSPSTDRCSAPEGAGANCGSPTEGAIADKSFVSSTGGAIASVILDNKIEVCQVLSIFVFKNH